MPTLKNEANKALNNGATNTSDLPVEDTGSKKQKPLGSDEMVSVPKGVLEQLLNDVQDLKTGRKQPVRRVFEHFASVKVIDEQYPVIGIEKTWVDNKGKPEEATMCRVKYLKDFDGLATDVKVYPYLDFLNEVNSYQVKILEQKAEQSVKNYGMIRKTNPDPIKMGDDGKAFTPGMAENIVTSVNYVSRVEFTEGALIGKTLSISNEWLNL